MSYDAHQRAAVLLICAGCGKSYFVTNAPKDWICARCTKVQPEQPEWAGYPLTWGDEG